MAEIALSGGQLPAAAASANELPDELTHQRACLAFGLRFPDLGDGLLPRLGGRQLRGLAENQVDRPELVDDADEPDTRIAGVNPEAEDGQGVVKNEERAVPVLAFPKRAPDGSGR